MPLKTANCFTIRVGKPVYEKLQIAADFSGSTLSQFVIQAALEKADKVIESETTIHLSRKDFLRALELIENPPPKNEKFIKAMSRWSKLKCSNHSKEN